MSNDITKLVSLKPVIANVIADTVDDPQIKISKKRLKRLKRRLKRMNRIEYDRYKKIMYVIEYNLLIELIISI